MRIALLAGLLMVGVAVDIFVSRIHENRYERVMHRIDDAILAGDVGPVAKEFTPSALAAMSPRQVLTYAGSLDRFGKLQRVQETTAPGAVAGSHDFVAHFENGEVGEHLQFVVGGQISELGINTGTSMAPLR